jgi:isopentenyl-diphosphate delta-isomerase
MSTLKDQEKQQSSDRKKDHIDLAFASRLAEKEIDGRFNYEPLLSAHPQEDQVTPIDFLGFTLKSPVWISSMTGGTAHAGKINRNLARACREFGMGMGLGSCRIILEDQSYFEDFNLRPVIGDKLPFYANLGIAQLERIFRDKKEQLIKDLLNRLQADGLIVHINPLQEWMQPEGDLISTPPLETIQRLIDCLDSKIIIKEVGQGMGPKSLKKLMRLPIAAIEFAAAGGTNFSRLELSRAGKASQDQYDGLAACGHTAEEMVSFVNKILSDKETLCKNFIISGGVRDFLDGYYLISKCNGNSIYGQASAMLLRAKESYDELAAYIDGQIKGYKMAEAFLRIKGTDER